MNWNNEEAAQLGGPIRHTTTAAVIHPARPISASQAKRFDVCAQAWFYDTAGYQARPDAEQAIGLAVHETAAAVLMARHNHQAEPGQPEIRDFARERTRAALLAAGLEDRGEAEDTAAKAAGAYFAAGAPGHSLQAVACERPAYLQIPNGPAVRGLIDIVTTDGRIIDLKVQRQKQKAGWAIDQHRLQLTTYAAAAGILRTELHQIVKTQVKPIAVYVAKFQPGPADIEHMLAAYRRIHRAMLTGSYAPNREHMLCKRRFCDHWEVCERENGGQVRA